MKRDLNTPFIVRRNSSSTKRHSNHVKSSVARVLIRKASIERTFGSVYFSGPSIFDTDEAVEIVLTGKVSYKKPRFLSRS